MDIHIHPHIYDDWSRTWPFQEYWSGLPFPSPGELCNPGMEPMSSVFPALAGRFFTTVPAGQPQQLYEHLKKTFK